MKHHLLIGWLWLLTIVVTSATPWKLVEQGQPRGVIALPPQPNEAEQIAAQELQSWLEKISGARLEIISPERLPAGQRAIVIGRHPENTTLLAALDRQHAQSIDAFALQSDGTRLRLVARSQTATLWAAWEWLERLGVRWLMPGRHGTFVPKNTEVIVEALDTMEAPRFLFRGPLAHIHPPEDPSVPEGFLAPEAHEMSAQRLFNLRMRLNDRTALIAQEEYYNLGSGHSYDIYLPPQKYYAEHPEWYNLIDGQRLDASHPLHQICFTNEEAAQEFARNVIESLNHVTGPLGVAPERVRVGVSPNDNLARCECEPCSQLKDHDGSTSSLIVHFANQVAKEVHLHHPKVAISVYAYINHSTAPDHVKPGPKVFVELCAWSGQNSFAVNQAHPLLSEKNPKFREHFEKWVAMSEGVSLYPYYGHYNWFTPWPMLTQMAYDLPRLAEVPHAYGVLSENHLHWGTQGITFWLYPRLLWNPKLDVRAAVADYCRAAYGPAADAFERHLWNLQASMDRQPYLSGTVREIPLVLDEATRTQGNALMAEAEAKLPEMEESMQWRTRLAIESWRQSAAFAEALLLLKTSQDPADRPKVVATLEGLLAFMESDMGKWAFEGAIARAPLRELLATVAPNFSRIPIGTLAYRDLLLEGGAFTLYGTLEGLTKGLWGLGLAPGLEGQARVVLRPEPQARFTALRISWSFENREALEARLTVRGEGGEMTFEGADAIHAGVDLPPELLGGAVEVELTLSHSSEGERLLLTGWEVQAQVGKSAP